GEDIAPAESPAPGAGGGSVTVWISRLKTGEGEALEKLHGRYWPFLVGLARRQLLGSARQAADEEDLAASVFLSVCRKLQAGQLPPPANRGDLVRQLTGAVARKVLQELRAHR